MLVILASLDQMRFNHQPEDVVLASFNLVDNVATHFNLLMKLLLAIGMAGIDHQTRVEPGRFKFLGVSGNADAIIVGANIPATQDDVCVVVA
jgi:hypothetical protein